MLASVKSSLTIAHQKKDMLLREANELIALLHNQGKSELTVREQIDKYREEIALLKK